MEDDGWGDDDDNDKVEDEEDEEHEEEAKDEPMEEDTAEKPDDGSRSPGAEDKADDDRPADASSPPADSALRHNLGRYTSPGKWATSPVQPATKGKPAPAHTSESLSPPSTRAMLDGYDDEKPLPKNSTNKRGTLGRGKTPRAANIWVADKEGEGEEVPPLPTSPIGMARKESVDSVVYVGKDEEGAEEALAESKAEPVPIPNACPASPATAPSVLEPGAHEDLVSPTSEPQELDEPKKEPSPSTSPEKTPSLSIPAPVPTTTSTLATSPRSELQARPGDNGRDQLSVSPRGTTGRRGQRKNRVPRSPGKKGQQREEQ